MRQTAKVRDCNERMGWAGSLFSGLLRLKQCDESRVCLQVFNSIENARIPSNFTSRTNDLLLIVEEKGPLGGSNFKCRVNRLEKRARALQMPKLGAVQDIFEILSKSQRVPEIVRPVMFLPCNEIELHILMWRQSLHNTQDVAVDVRIFRKPVRDKGID
jgi:hypothetical protein